MDSARPSGSSGAVAPPPAIYAAALIVGLLLDRLRPVRILPHDVARVVGPLLLVLSMVGTSGFLAFRRHRTSPNPYRPSSALVTDGPFRFTRNPMYVGFTLIYLGVTLWIGTLWPLLLLPVVLVVMQRGVIAREERYLESLFGEEYRAYRGRVRRWI